MLSEISHTERQILYNLTCGNLKHTHTHNSYVQRTDWWLAEAGGGGGGLGETGEVGQKVQTSSYKIISGNVMYSVVTVITDNVLYIRKLLREYILESSHHKEKISKYVW